MLDGMMQRNQYSFGKLMRIVKKQGVDLNEFKYVAIPINLTHYHWYTVLVDLRERRLYAVDSI